MKLVLLGDIHSNYMALEKCFLYCQEIRVDGFVFLGDYISDCPYPQKTMELIKKIDKMYQTWFIRGNREDYQLNHHEGIEDGWHYCSNSGSLLYTYENLKEQDFELFKKCDITRRISIPDMPEFTICHGSPNSSRELLHIGSELALKSLSQSETNLLICAHTHIQGVYEAYGKMLINPGSIGVPVGSNGKLQFAILHGIGGTWKPEFISLDYDIEKFIEEYMNSDLIYKANVFTNVILHTLRTGHNYLLDIMTKTQELTLVGEGKVNPSDMPEKYWEEAYKIIFHNGLKNKTPYNVWD